MGLPRRAWSFPVLRIAARIAAAAPGAITLVAMVGGCISNSSRGFALYPVGASPADVSQVARLDGYVEGVDGTDVSAHGTSFELMPGCHIVETPTHWSSSAGGVVATTGTQTFALPMRAGHAYAIVVELKMGGGPTGSVHIQGYERDSSGATTRTFQRAESDDDLRRCRLEAADAPR